MSLTVGDSVSDRQRHRHSVSVMMQRIIRYDVTDYSLRPNGLSVLGHQKWKKHNQLINNRLQKHPKTRIFLAKRLVG